MKQTRMVFALCKNLISLVFYRREIKVISIDTSSLVALDGIPIKVSWSVQNALFVQISTGFTLFSPVDSTEIITNPSVGPIYLQAYSLFSHKRVKLPLIPCGGTLNVGKRGSKFGFLSNVQTLRIKAPVQRIGKPRGRPLLKPRYSNVPICRSFFTLNNHQKTPKLFLPKIQSPGSFHNFKNNYQTRFTKP